jgi:hypothetical protein
MAVLATLHGLRCGDLMLEYVSRFYKCVSCLTSFDGKLGKELTVAILLRGLPPKYSNIVSSIKVRERLPEIEEVINLVFFWNLKRIRLQIICMWRNNHSALIEIMSRLGAGYCTLSLHRCASTVEDGDI